MAKLRPPNGTKMTKQHYEWLAWSIREVAFKTGAVDSLWETTDEDTETLQSLAELWAYECQGTNPAFNRDRFISAVVRGEWTLTRNGRIQNMNATMKGEGE
jgi:hypothetical protein